MVRYLDDFFVGRLKGGHVANEEFLDIDLHILRAGCFAYFERGGDCIDGPVSLLAG